KDLENYKKFGAKEELPANFFAPKTAAPAASGFGSGHGAVSQPDVTMELDSAWTPAMTATEARDVAFATANDSMVAVADTPVATAAIPMEVVPVKETVYTEPEAKPAVATK